MGKNIEDVLGYSVSNYKLTACIESILEKLRDTASQNWLACINPHSYVVALNDSIFSDALHGADWLVPDGSGIVFASQFLGGNIYQRITGSDIFYALNAKMNELGDYSVFFLGSASDNLQQIEARMARDYPNVRVAGCYSPPYRSEYSDDELEAMIAAINKAKPDVLWVGMTAPKQEKWIYQNLPRLNVRFAAAIGAVFDFYTGRVKRSHPIFQKLGLEWLPRLIQEPRRLWRRNFVSTPVFLWHVLLRLFLKS